MRRSRIFAILLPLLLAAARAPAQPQLGRPTNDVVLHVWDVPSKISDDPIFVGRRRVVEEFLRRNPKISLWSLIPLQIQGPAAGGREFMAVAGGVAPDIFYLTGRQVAEYRAQGFLYPLNDYIADYARRTGTPYVGINSPEQVWELCYDKGKIVCVPVSYFSTALICNRHLLAKAGFGEHGPRNWEELYSYARRLTRDPSKEPGADPHEPQEIGLRMATGLDAGGEFIQYVWSSGGEVVRSFYPLPDGSLLPVPPPPVDYAKFHIALSDEDAYEQRRARALAGLTELGVREDYSIEDLQWRLETNSPAAIEALKFYRRLIHQPWLRNRDHEFDITPEMLRSRRAVDPQTGDVFPLDDPDVRKRIYHGVADAVALQQGRSSLQRIEYAMRLGVIDEADINNPASLLSFPFPSRDDAPPAAVMQARYLAINATIEPSDESGRSNVKKIRQAAWDYIEYSTSPRAQEVRMNTFIEFGMEEYVRPSLLVDAGYAHLLERIPEDRRRLWDDLTLAARVEPYCDGFNHVKTRELGGPIEKLINDPPDELTGEYRHDLQAIMDETVAHVNSMILGKMPASEVRRRARVGWVIFAVMLVGLFLAGALVVRVAVRTQRRLRDSEGFGVGGHPARRRLHAWLLLVPAIATVLIWNYYPLTKGMAIAFQEYRILGGSHYVGLRNFVEVTSEPLFWRYILQTAQYVVMSIGLGFCVPIVLAILLTEIPTGKVFFRVIYYLPAVTTGLVTLFLWKNLLYDPTPNGAINRLILAVNKLPVPAAAVVRAAVLMGLLAAILGLARQAASTLNSPRERVLTGAAAALLSAGVVAFFASRLSFGPTALADLAAAFWRPFSFEAQKFLRDPKLAMLWCVVPGIWAGAGSGCLIYLAALKGIPDEQYEAADIDGAGVWKKFWNVTFPNIHALIIINFVGAVIGSFHASSNIFIMTGGGPENATMTVGLEIWYNAFLYLKFGTATAMAWIMGSFLIGFTLTQLRILNKLQFRSAAVDAAAAGGRA
ncbi:MAG: extracellular solute-binding protein [Planctomycetota bacterium]